MKHVYEKLHANRYTHAEQELRAGEMQAELADAYELLREAFDCGLDDIYGDVIARIAAKLGGIETP